MDPASRPRLLDCTGALIAGGQARRLGGLPKGLLELQGEPLVARALRTFGELFADSVVVANDGAPYERFGVRIVQDRIRGKGAPGGLHAALAAARTEWIFAAACDMPFLRTGPISWLADHREGASAVIVAWRGRLEPLHSFWSRSSLPVIERMLADGNPSMWEVAAKIGARIIDETEWSLIDPEGSSFANANTAEDLIKLGLSQPGSNAPDS